MKCPSETLGEDELQANSSIPIVSIFQKGLQDISNTVGFLQIFLGDKRYFAKGVRNFYRVILPSWTCPSRPERKEFFSFQYDDLSKSTPLDECHVYMDRAAEGMLLQENFKVKLVGKLW